MWIVIYYTVLLPASSYFVWQLSRNGISPEPFIVFTIAMIAVPLSRRIRHDFSRNHINKIVAIIVIFFAYAAVIFILPDFRNKVCWSTLNVPSPETLCDSAIAALRAEGNVGNDNWVCTATFLRSRHGLWLVRVGLDRLEWVDSCGKPTNAPMF